MSDYLNTLVARTLRLEPVVQPRLASLFEPVLPGPANQFASEVSETRSLPSRLVAELSDLPGEKKKPNTASSDTNEWVGEVLQSHPVRATFLPAPVVPPSPLSINNTADTREAGDQELPAPLSGTDSITTSSKTHSNPTPTRIKPEVRIISTTTDRVQVQPLPSMPAYAAPPNPMSSTRKAGTEASTPAEATEAVVVTIGRVDVRAIFPPPAATPRSQRVQQKTMSLDEYLKQRSEGRR